MNHQSQDKSDPKDNAGIQDKPQTQDKQSNDNFIPADNKKTKTKRRKIVDDEGMLFGKSFDGEYVDISDLDEMLGKKVLVNGTLSNSSEALDEAIKQALDHAGLKVSDIDAIVGFGNGCEVIDNEEISSYKRVFGENFTTPVVSTKARTGEGRAASAALNVVQASLLLSNTIDHDDFAYVNENGKMTKKTLSSEGLSHILVTAYGSGGSYTAVILSK